MKSAFTAGTAIFLGTLLATTGCHKDEVVFQAYTATAALLTTDLGSIREFQNKSSFTFKGLDKDTVLAVEGGYHLTLLHADSLFADAAGRPVPCSTCPELTLETETAAAPGVLIAKNLHTLDGSGQLLTTAGTIGLQARCQGQALQLQPQRYIIVNGPHVLPTDKFFLYNAASRLMGQPFNGWSGTGQEATIIQSSSNPSMLGFQTEMRQTGWLGVCRPLNRPVTPFYVSLPVEYSDANTQVYLVLKGQTGVAPLKYVEERHFFRYDFAPLDLEAQVVTVSKMQDGWHYGRRDVYPQQQKSVTLIPKLVSETDLIKQLNAL